MTHEGKSISQLDHFVSLGLFQSIDENGKSDVSEAMHSTRKFELPSPVDVLAHLVDPADLSMSVDSRARSYLHVNCAHCHVKEGAGNSQFSVKFGTSLATTRLLNEVPTHDAFGVADARLVVPKNPHRSLLLHRMQYRGRDQMPPLVTSVVDQDAVKLLADWTQSLEETAIDEAVDAIASP